jgi:predicted transporter
MRDSYHDYFRGKNIIKKRSEIHFTATFGVVLMLMGGVIEVYELMLAIVLKPKLNVYGIVVDFIIPLVLIYYGYHILLRKPFRFPIGFRI